MQENQISLNFESGGAGESHPHAPTDPCVNLSIHTAPAGHSLETSRSQAYAERNPVPPSYLVDLHLLRAGSSPSFQPHYRTFRGGSSSISVEGPEMAHPLRSSPISGPSTLILDDPPLCLASVLSFSWDLHLNFSLNIEATGSHVPHKSLTQSHAIFTPEAA